MPNELPETMKGVLLAGPHNLVERDLAMPKPLSDEVLMRVRACGICGSDVHFVLFLAGH